MKVKRYDVYLCSDCMQVASNGANGIELADRSATIEGIKALGPHLVPDFDSETRDGLREFSNVPCSACRTKLAGYRARFAILG